MENIGLEEETFTIITTEAAAALGIFIDREDVKPIDREDVMSIDREDFNSIDQNLDTSPNSSNLASKVQRCYTKRKSDIIRVEKAQVGVSEKKRDNQSSAGESKPSDIVNVTEKRENGDAIVVDKISKSKDVADPKQPSSAELSNSRKRKFSCKVEDCHSSFFHRGSYLRHKKMYHETSNYICRICFKSFDDKGDLQAHQENYHKGLSNLKPVCSHCNKMFSSEDYRDRHLNKVLKKGSSLNCGKCTKIFHSVSDFKYHMKHTHVEGRTFSCKECFKLFKRETHAAAHMKTHSARSLFTCEICNQDFKNLHFLKRHSTVHDANKHTCSVCHAGFAYLSSLTKHLNDQHPRFNQQLKDKKQIKSEGKYSYYTMVGMG
ncbi:uncharacterized protein LOC111058374 isoform X2 [Nilaparvata lugens]|uniref:uncharacterized protein LOC111058374 isoform X2 n=1 Tax=Nilaparvata lugens TaxID=108931 RepID=UPI000B998D97|nr:uncharacterized protein LOC111058374 isoform X2 [Nilaparvata lugens]